MSVVYGFLTILMLILLAYSLHRTIKRMSMLMLIPVSLQLFALVLIIMCFCNDVEALAVIETAFITFGILLPAVLLICDYRRMMSKFRYSAVPENSSEELPADDPAFPGEGINDIESIRPVSEIIGELRDLPEKIRMNFRKCAQKAEMYLRNNEPDKALSIWETLIILAGNSGTLHYNYGCICYKQAMFEQALDSFKRSLELFSGRDAEKRRIYYNLGNSSYMKGCFEDAAMYYEKTLQLDPDDFKALENLSYAYFRLGEESRGIEILKRIGEGKAGYRPHYIWGRLFSETERFDEAEKELRKAAKLKPDSPKILEELGKVLMKCNKPDEAAAIYKKILELAPDNFVYWYNIANAYVRTKRWKDAVACYEKAIHIRPDSSDAYYSMAVALNEAGNRKAAIRAYEKAIGLCPGFIDAYNNLGILLSLEGRYGEAAEIYEKALGIEPGKSSLYFNLGICMMESGRYMEAAGAFRTALDLDPEKPDVYYYLGAALTEMHHYSDAAEAYASAIRIKPAEGEIFYNLASVYAMTGRYDIAAGYLKKAAECDRKHLENVSTDCAFDGMRSRIAAFNTVISLRG